MLDIQRLGRVHDRSKQMTVDIVTMLFAKDKQC